MSKPVVYTISHLSANACQDLALGPDMLYANETLSTPFLTPYMLKAYSQGLISVSPEPNKEDIQESNAPEMPKGSGILDVTVQPLVPGGQVQFQETPMIIEPIVDGFISPAYGTEGSAAFDVFLQQDSLTLEPGKPVTIHLGFKAQVPVGHCAIMMPRSGHGVKKGTILVNTVGLIDSDYPNEWMAVMSLNGAGLEQPESVTFNKGQAVLQCAIVPVARVRFVVGSVVQTTSRSGGYGHTGN